ncbi:MAG: LamG domain-containing protein [Bacteroidales bacterium]|nr:LamG domain-containing protein [Bacteroidales bacterium]
MNKNRLVLMIIFSLLISGSCKKDDKTNEGDKTVLNALIVSAEQIAANASAPDYPQPVIDDFKATIEEVKLNASGSLTQVGIDALVIQLTQAKDAFEAYTPLSVLIRQADEIAQAATPADYPETAIYNFLLSLQIIKSAYSVPLNQDQISQLMLQLNEAITTLNFYKTEAYSDLYSLILQAQALYDVATTDLYPQSAITNFHLSLESIKSDAATLLTEIQLNNLFTQLTETISVFQSQQYTLIDESLYLNAGWHFDEGSGTIATAFSTINHIATFKPGNSVLLGNEAMSPSWVEGVKGGSAVYLNMGAHLEVPYTSSFLPENLSISVWVKPDVMYESNYIVSQNYWMGYKLQTQGDGKPFFTYTKTDGGITDADNELDNSIRAGEWNHIVISLNSVTKQLKFFNNGQLTKTWTEDDKGIGPLTRNLVSPDPQPFIIGCMATDAEIAASFMGWITAENFGYFKGVIDELRIYNIAVNEDQVLQLYNSEKP